MNIVGVIGAAALGAIVGDNIGYWVGREFGYPLLVRFGRYVGLTEARIKLGQYLFLRHGGKVVFFGRFFAVLRVLAAFLAGVNRMEWKTFLLANAAGGVLWSLVYGVGAYIFGTALLSYRTTRHHCVGDYWSHHRRRGDVVRALARSRAGAAGGSGVARPAAPGRLASPSSAQLML